MDKFINHPLVQWVLAASGYKRLKGPTIEINQIYLEKTSMMVIFVDESDYLKLIDVVFWREEDNPKELLKHLLGGAMKMVCRKAQY